MNIKSLLLLVLAIGLSLTATSSAFARSRNPLLVEASFSENWSRYPSPDTILSTLRAQFPLAAMKTISMQCLISTQETNPILGGNSAIKGAPTIKSPNSAFVVWYTGCLKDFIADDYTTMYTAYINKPDLKLISDYLGPKFFSLCQFDGKATSPSYSGTCHWPNIPKKERIDAIAERVEAMLGPDDVIRDSGIAQSAQDLAARIDDEMLSTLARNPSAFKFIGIDPMYVPDSLGTLQVVRAVEFLTLLNDSLKY